MNFTYSLKGPTSKTGINSPDDSLVLYSDNDNSVLFNTDSVEDWENSITMIIRDEKGNTVIAIDYLDNRVKNNEIFGIKLLNNDNILYGAFARGTYNICLCSINDLKIN